MEKINELIMGTQMNADFKLDDTYIGDDGLLYCSKCHTLRMTKNIIEVFS